MSYLPEQDWDLKAAFEYNGADINLEDIAEVLACDEGRNDEESWYWVVRLENGEIWSLVGWCDYTGWDCRSGLSSDKINSVEELKSFSVECFNQIEKEETVLPWSMQPEQEWAKEYPVIDLKAVNVVPEIDVSHDMLERALECTPEWTKDPIKYVHAYLCNGNFDFSVHMWIVETFDSGFVYVVAYGYNEEFDYSSVMWQPFANFDQLSHLTGTYAAELVEQGQINFADIPATPKIMSVLTGLVQAIVVQKMATTTVRPTERVAPYRAEKAFEKSTQKER